MGRYRLLLEAHVSLHQTRFRNGHLESLPADPQSAIIGGLLYSQRLPLALQGSSGRADITLGKQSAWILADRPSTLGATYFWLCIGKALLEPAC